MKIKVIAGIALACGLAALSYFWINRDPLARLSAPTGYVYTGIEMIDTETGKPATFEEAGLFGAMFAAMGEQLTRAAERGYLMVDPAARTAHLRVKGITSVAPLPEPGQESSFDHGGAASGPVFLTYSRGRDRFTVRAPETALNIGYEFFLTFVRAPQDISDRIATQDALQAQRLAELAKWNKAMDELQSALTPAPDQGTAPQQSYRLNLPGDMARASVPMAVSLGDSELQTAPALIDRAEGQELLNLRLRTKAQLAGVIDSARDQLLDPPNEDTRLLYQDDRTLVVARRGKPIQFLATAEMGNAGYLMQAAPQDGAQLQTVWRIVKSMSAAPPDPAIGIEADFDALAWFADRGLTLAARTQYNQNPAEFFQDKLAENLRTEDLISDSFNIRTEVTLHKSAEIEDLFAEKLFRANLACEPRLTTNDSPTRLHERLSRAPYFGGLAYRDLNTEQLAAIIANDALDMIAEFQFDPNNDLAPRSPPVWAWQSASGAFGADNLSYFAYQTRDLGGPFQLVCATSADNPYAARALLQIFQALPLPDLSDLPPLAEQHFGRYASASAVGDGLYRVTETRDGGSVLIDANGRKLSQIPFEWLWEYSSHRVFETLDANDKHALWTYSGEQLLPYEYDDFDSEGDDLIRTYQQDQSRLYSVSRRAFVADPAQQP